MILSLYRNETTKHWRLKMKVFKTKEECLAYAIEEYSALQIETGVIYAAKIGPMIAKHLGCETGWAVSCEF